jgi:YaiO family outer membrane protein
MKRGLLCFSLLLLFVCRISAQSPDSLLGIAQQEAVQNHFAEANRIMVPLIAQYPKNSDYTVFYGALCSWMHKYDSSKTILRQVIATNPNNLGAYDALTNTEIWSKDDSMAIIDCNKALLIPDVNKEFYLLKIAEAQRDLQNFPPAYTLVDSLLGINPGDTSAKNMRTDIYSAVLQKTADSLFDTALHMSYRKQYIPAEIIARKLTLQYAAVSEYMLLWSRILGYTGKTDTSEIMLRQIIAAEPENLEAYDALAGDEIIALKFKHAIVLSDTALKMPVKADRTSLIITKASAQDNMENYYGALITLDTLVKKHPDNKEAVDLYEAIHVHIIQKKADSLFAAAQKDADKKNYKEAQTKLDTITKWFPDNADYMLLKGRVYCWEDKYDLGIAMIAGVISKEPHNMDAYDALTDAEMDKKKYLLTVSDCDKALQDSMFAGYPTMSKQRKDSISITTPILKNTSKTAKDSNARKYYSVFMLKRAHALYTIEEYQQCVNTLDTMHKVDSTNKDANNLLTEAKIKLLKNVVQVGYLNNSFNAPPAGPLHYAWMEYMRNFYHCPVYVKATYGSIYGLPVGWRDGWQYEVGAYPKFTPSTYGDVSVAYSNSFAVFPKWQITTDLYQKLPYGFEASVGGIYMHFIDVVETPATPPQDVWILDPSIGYYIGDKYQLTYKPYFAFKSSNVYLTHTVTLRRFLGNEDSWVSLYGAIGTSPFVDYYFPSPVPTSIKLIGIDYQTRLPHNWLIWPMLSYEYEEYYPATNSWRNMFYAQIIITKRF